MHRAAIPLLVTLASVQPLFAQYRFDSWTTNEGLPQNSVQAILQSRDGYLWLTTFDGLVRFDGVRFTVFNRANTPGIKSNRFTALFEDRDGVLWAGTEHDGLTRYDGRRFETFAIGGEGSGLIRGITGDDSGRLWLLRDDQVLEWHDHKATPVATGFTDVPNIRAGIYGRGGFAGFWSARQSELRLFMAGRTTIVPASTGLPTGRVDAVVAGRDGTLWVVGDAGAAKRRNDRLALHDSAVECGPSRKQLAFSPQATLACVDRQGNLLLIRLESHERIMLGAHPAGLTGDLIGSVFYEDREGNFWLGNALHGLHRARRQVVKTVSRAQGLRDQTIYPVFQDRRGAIWLGAWMRTLTRLESGRVENFSTEVGLSGDPITALFEDRDQRLWVGSIGNGSGVRVREGDTFVVPRGLEALARVKAIHQDRSGTMWFGTETRLARWRDGVISSYTAKDGLAGNDVQVIVESASGDLWFAGARGLTRLHDGRFTSYTEETGLPGNHVRSVYEDADGVLWIGTYDSGLARFKHGRFTRYSTREGLFDDGVFQILEDNRGHLWMSSNRGIYRVSKHELDQVADGQVRTVTSVSYGRSDGMRSVEANGGSWPAGIKAHDGTLWFPTQDGVVTIDPENLSSTAEPPAVRIEACRVDRASVSLETPVRVEPGQRDLEIDYTALTFINSARVRFRYKLEGLDDEWIDAGTRRTAYYTAVPPGTYTFTVIAANSDGVWNTTGSSVPLVFLPPFYQTWWFIALATTVGAGLVVAGGKRRETRLKRAHAIQQAFSQQLMASQESERKRIAGELHDSLGQRLVVIKNLAMLADAARTNGGHEHVSQISAEASDAIAEVREIARNLRPHHLDRLGLTRALEVLVDQAAAASGIEFSTDIDRLDGVFPKDAEINVYRVVQEGINNMLKHSQATDAAVTLRLSASHLQLTMRDNGRGFSAPGRDDDIGGFGLIGLAERVRLVGGRSSIQSTPGRGTTISAVFDLPEGNRVH